jgi:hypothetical protein
VDWISASHHQSDSVIVMYARYRISDAVDELDAIRLARVLRQCQVEAGRDFEVRVALQTEVTDFDGLRIGIEQCSVVNRLTPRSESK